MHLIPFSFFLGNMEAKRTRHGSALKWFTVQQDRYNAHTYENNQRWKRIYTTTQVYQSVLRTQQKERSVPIQEMGGR